MSVWPYQTLGRPEQPPLLFLHGFMGCGEDWLPLAEALADQFYCLMPDLPGHGRHLALPLDQPLHFQNIVLSLERFLDELALEQVSLVGYSMGGRLALYTAVTLPGRVQALALEGANPGLAEDQARRQRASLDDDYAELLLTEGVDRFMERWYDLALFSSLKARPALLAALKAGRRQNDPRWLAKIISELSPGRQPALWERLEKLSMPVLFMAGALDTKYTTLALELKVRLPQAEVALIPGAGHNIHLEQPELFVRRLRAFLGSSQHD
jgi:2-succinyl-6-hydroxy-2,4-cyclohexadiene-1-carboxylate synthase